MFLFFGDAKNSKKIFPMVLLVVFVLCVLMAPVVLYAYKFGFGLWNDHEDWAMMGDFFAGVLGPVITGFSVIFLAIQVKDQTKQRKEEEFLRSCRESELDIKMYVGRVKECLPYGDDERVQDVSRNVMMLKDSGDLEGVSGVVNNFIEHNLSLFNSWVMIDIELRSLEKKSEYNYKRMKYYIISNVNVDDMVSLEIIRQNVEGAPAGSKIYTSNA